MPIYRVEGLRLGDIPLPPCESFAVNLEPIEERIDRRIDFVLGANAMLASGLVWVLDESNGALLVSPSDIRVQADNQEESSSAVRKG